MISAKLIKDLEKIGFELDFPSYSSNDDRIFEILKTNNQRLFLAIPLLLRKDFDYEMIINRLSSSSKADYLQLKKEFDKIITITNKILILGNMDNSNTQSLIYRNSIREEIRDEEFNYYYNYFKEFSKKSRDIEDKKLGENIKIRSKLNINRSLSEIFSPAKIRIMGKIFSHDKLTNTELKYYYKSIKPLIHAILNERMNQYLRIIDSSKKYY
ncbi:hypothetical protein ISS07_06810 [Candidatus Woesearchaeota archaeon]|nr:hypothetical protein [Candidatus Woesearchaeota archaeon]